MGHIAHSSHTRHNQINFMKSKYRDKEWIKFIRFKKLKFFYRCFHVTVISYMIPCKIHLFWPIGFVEKKFKKDFSQYSCVEIRPPILATPDPRGLWLWYIVPHYPIESFSFSSVNIFSIHFFIKIIVTLSLSLGIKIWTNLNLLYRKMFPLKFQILLPNGF